MARVTNSGEHTCDELTRYTQGLVKCCYYPLRFSGLVEG